MKFEIPSKENAGVFLLYAGGFYLYFVILLLIFRFGLAGQSQLITIPYRAGFLCLAGVMIIYGLRSKSIVIPRWLLICVAIFWSLWLLRWLVDCYLSPVLLTMSPRDYFLRAIGMAAIPMFAFGWTLTRSNRWAFFGFFLSLGLFNLLVFLVYRGSMDIASYRMLQYLGIDRAGLISPLSISYAGGMLATLSLWVLLRRDTRAGGMIFAFVGIALGGVNCMMGASRGAILAIVVCGVIFLVTGWRTRHVLRRFAAVGAAIVVVGILVAFSPVGQGAVNRTLRLFEEMQYLDDRAGSGRMLLYRSAVSQFISSPLIGDSLVERESRNYPHNHVLEAYMATGIFGGTAFVVILFMGFRYSLRLLNRQDERSWIAVLYINFSVLGMFSSSIIGQSFWYALFAVVANGMTLPLLARQSHHAHPFPRQSPPHHFSRPEFDRHNIHPG